MARENGKNAETKAMLRRDGSFYIPLLPTSSQTPYPSFRCSSFPHKISDFVGSPIRQADFVSQKSCACAAARVTKSVCPTAAKKRLPPHSALLQSAPSTPFRVDRKQRDNTHDFPTENRVPTGVLAPLLKTRRQRGAPFEIPHFPRRRIYNCKNAACNACSENEKENSAAARYGVFPQERTIEKRDLLL